MIGENLYRDRVFFGDNWPNRERHWLPTLDHPSDKATSEFLVIAPNHYSVVTNGLVRMPIEFEVTYEDNSVESKVFYADKKKNLFTVKLVSKPTDVTLDPNVWLLMEDNFKKQ